MDGSAFGFDDLLAAPSRERLVREAIERATSRLPSATDPERHWENWKLVALILGATPEEVARWPSLPGPITLEELVAESRKLEREEKATARGMTGAPGSPSPSSS